MSGISKHMMDHVKSLPPEMAKITIISMVIESVLGCECAQIYYGICHNEIFRSLEREIAQLRVEP